MQVGFSDFPRGLPKIKKNRSIDEKHLRYRWDLSGPKLHLSNQTCNSHEN